MEISSGSLTIPVPLQCSRIKNYKSDEKIIFIKAWNEWAEGNYLEPDSKTGFDNLNEIKNFLEN